MTELDIAIETLLLSSPLLGFFDSDDDVLETSTGL